MIGSGAGAGCEPEERVGSAEGRGGEDDWERRTGNQRFNCSSTVPIYSFVI